LFHLLLQLLFGGAGDFHDRCKGQLVPLHLLLRLAVTSSRRSIDDDTFLKLRDL
jgi:hypothetical protein